MPPHGHAHGHGFGASRPAASAPTWVPSDVSGLLVWYDCKSDPSHSLYQESTGSPPGSTLADTDGETIGAWRDRSASGDHFTQSTAGARPAYSSTALGGKPCAVFDGSSDYLRRVDSVTASTFTVGFAWQITTLPGAGSFVGVGGVNFTVGACELLIMNAVGGYKNITVNCNSGAGVGVSPTLDTSAHYLVATYDGTGTNDVNAWDIWLDGVAQTVLSSGLVIPSSAHAIGVRTSGSNQITGRVGAMLGYNSVLSAGDIADLNTWLAGVVS